jgi:carbonic anhydrase
MCATCGFFHHRGVPSRRGFLALGAGLAAALAAPASAKDAKPPPKPENVLSPEQSLERLMRGNRRYVKGDARRHDFVREREALVGGQNPFAGILSCADSRIAPEYAFDSSRGDLFVVRLAGNFANADAIASFEYAVAILKTPLIMVLGHAACGAVASTIASLRDKTTLPGHLPSLVASLAPAVEASFDKPGDLLENATKENVRRTMKALATATPILSEAVDKKSLKIVGGYYHLTNGTVELLA